MPTETRTGFYVRLPSTMLRKLRITAAKTGRSMQELVEYAISLAQRERSGADPETGRARGQKFKTVRGVAADE